MSFGATIFTPKDMNEAGRKIKLADETLYVDKNCGRNTAMKAVIIWLKNRSHIS